MNNMNIILMKPLSVNQLAVTVNGILATGDGITCFDGVSIDSRTIRPGEVFFAIQGEHFDGHHYAGKAIEKGACCVVAERAISTPENCNTSIVQVDDTIKALGQFAKWYRRQLQAKVIAITGSVGKTTTRNILYQILSRFIKCRQAPKSYNNHIGVPLTVLLAEPQDEILLLELGSNHPGEIPYLTRIADPDIALITYVTHSHLEGFGSIENIIKEKASIAQGVSAGGTFIINGDLPELVDHVRATYDLDIVTVGTGRDCDVIGTDLKTAGSHGSLVIEGQTVRIPLAGRASLLNVLFAWAVCREFISLPDFIEAVESLKAYDRRLVPVTIGPVMVLDDCYNANPASMSNALDCLHSMANESGRRAVFVAGCMAELGHQSEKLHEELGQLSACCEVKVLLAAGPFSDQICRGAQNAAEYSLESRAYEKTEHLCDNLHKWIHPDDIILVKGSRSTHLEQVIERLKHIFED